MLSPNSERRRRRLEAEMPISEMMTQNNEDVGVHTMVVYPRADFLHDGYIGSDTKKTQGNIVHHGSKRGRRCSGMPNPY